ncbi:unnamed protein product, partial [Effrenium voratum]
VSDESIHRPLTSAADIGQEQVVHGTYLRHWLKIRLEGLRKMSRNHIHLCLGLPGSGVVSGMRHSCEVAIHINLQAAIDGGVKLMQSSNGVILTPGEGEGVLAPRYFTSAVWLGPNQRVKIYDCQKGDLLTEMRRKHPELQAAVEQAMPVLLGRERDVRKLTVPVSQVQLRPAWKATAAAPKEEAAPAEAKAAAPKEEAAAAEVKPAPETPKAEAMPVLLARERDVRLKLTVPVSQVQLRPAWKVPAAAPKAEAAPAEVTAAAPKEEAAPAEVKAAAPKAEAPAEVKPAPETPKAEAMPVLPGRVKLTAPVSQVQLRPAWKAVVTAVGRAFEETEEEVETQAPEKRVRGRAPHRVAQSHHRSRASGRQPQRQCPLRRRRHGRS